MANPKKLLTPVAGLQDKGSQVFNVLAYGAKGDGTTNDTTAVQAALTAAASVGGEVLVPQGTFMVSNITVGANVTLRGTGRGSILKAVASSTGAMIAFTTASTARGVTIHNIHLDGNNENMTGISLVNTGVANDSLHRLDRIWIEKFGVDGLYVGAAVIESSFTNIFVKDSGRHGYNINVAATDNRFINCSTGRSTDHGWLVQGNNNHLIGCKAFYAGHNGTSFGTGKSGFRFYPNTTEDLHAVFVTSCESQNNSYHGFDFDGSASSATITAITAIGNIADANSEGDAFGCGFSFNNVRESSIVANVARTGNDGQAHNFGLALFGNLTGTRLTGNYFEGTNGRAYIDGTASSYKDMDVELDNTVHLTGNESIDGIKTFLDGLNVAEGAASDSSKALGIDAPFGTIAGNNVVARAVAWHGKFQFVSKYGGVEFYATDTDGTDETNVMTAEREWLNMNSHKIINVTDPTNAQDAATKAYVDANSGGGGGITYTEVTGTSQTAAVNSGYILNNSSLVTVTLPSTAAVGSVISLIGKGAGMWRLAQPASTVVNHGSSPTTAGTGGYIQATNRYDSIEIVCIIANTTWVAKSSIGNLTVV